MAELLATKDGNSMFIVPMLIMEELILKLDESEKEVLSKMDS